MFSKKSRHCVEITARTGSAVKSSPPLGDGDVEIEKHEAGRRAGRGLRPATRPTTAPVGWTSGNASGSRASAPTS